MHHDLTSRTKLVACETQVARNEIDAIHDALGLVARCRGSLVQNDFAIWCHADDIGKGPAYVDPYAIAGRHPAPTRISARSSRVAC